MIGKACELQRNREPRAAGADARRVAGRRGMTLAELLVALTILSVLFGLLFMPLMRSFGYIHTGSQRISVQDVSRTTFEALIREVSDAVDIYDNEDDPTRSSLIMVLAQGAGANANMDPSTGQTGTTTRPPILITPGPGPDYNVTTPLHVHYLMALSRPGEPYANENEVDSRDIRTSNRQDPNADLGTNLYRFFRMEYYPYNSSATPDPAAESNLLPNILGAALYPAGQYGLFREPGTFEDSPFTRLRNNATDLRNSNTQRDRRLELQKFGLLAPLTPAEMDAAWVTYSPPDTATSTPGLYSMKPGIRFESEAVRGELMRPLYTGSVPHPSAYQAARGHWQTARRKDWSHPDYNAASELPAWAMYFQLWQVSVEANLQGGPHRYYVAARPTDPSNKKVLDTDPTNPNLIYYYVFRRSTGQTNPPDGPWPGGNPPVFNMTRYQANVSRFRRGPSNPDDRAIAETFWRGNNPYHDPAFPSLFPETITDSTKPYWPEMAFLLDPRRGVTEFRLDPPVRVPKDDLMGEYKQPSGPMAPFQAPYGAATDAEFVPPPVHPTDPNVEPRTDWIIPDVRRRDVLTQAGTDTFATVYVPSETMRVMVYEPAPGGGYVWQAYTRVSREPGRREFAYDEQSGHLALGDENKQYWVGADGRPDPHTKVRAWYQIQCNATTTPGDVTVTASYYTKEAWQVTLAVRAYDNGTGRAQPFQLTATVRPRNLR